MSGPILRHLLNTPIRRSGAASVNVQLTFKLEKCIPATILSSRRPKVNLHKKLRYRRRTARRVLSVKILSTVETLYNKSIANRSKTVRGLQLTDL